ncbi:MAG: UDP-N-acetylglucosamine 2-epimerase (non-hydrolyzing) [Deltaproteobacteria bacterium]|nr:UDP-N-acetylglucosamine 2-epimerase (non-hydrolyzing) [Deltaproteobacteria bacterium]
MKVLTVFGTRPEAIKLAPVIKGLEAHGKFTSIVCVTAQHRQMLDQVLGIFDIKPDYDLDIMASNQTLYDITARGLLGMRPVIEEARPDVVLVQGDTTTTFVGSLAAFYERVPVAHVEAGLRTYDKYRPFPEEVNRRLTSQIADFHFAPTGVSRDNLLKEGVDPRKVHVTGNTVIDSLLMVTAAQSAEKEKRKWTDFFGKLGLPINDGRKIILVTGHRRENFGEGFDNICAALKEIASSAPDADIVYPVHLNPNVQGVVRGVLSGIKNVYLLPTLEYEPFVYLMSKSYMILTDSGGVQEEAPSLGKPVLVMRDTTERPEGVAAGTVRLVGTDRNKIVTETLNILNDTKAYMSMSSAHNPYGDGQAAKTIVRILEKGLIANEAVA